jgi:hypothetical protein
LSSAASRFPFSTLFVTLIKRARGASIFNTTRDQF